MKQIKRKRGLPLLFIIFVLLVAISVTRRFKNKEVETIEFWQFISQQEGTCEVYKYGKTLYKCEVIDSADNN